MTAAANSSVRRSWKHGPINFVLLVGVCFSVLSILASTYLFVRGVKKFPRGVLSDYLYKQRLSHIAFHHPFVKETLARMVSKPGEASIAVVGVEWGAEVMQFANLGYKVYAFEPMTRYVSYLKGRVSAHKDWNVSVIQIAAGKGDVGNITLNYHTEGQDVTEVVRTGKVDDHIREEVAVFSLDIQGNELDVLQGSPQLLKKYGVRSLVRSAPPYFIVAEKSLYSTVY